MALVWLTVTEGSQSNTPVGSRHAVLSAVLHLVTQGESGRAKQLAHDHFHLDRSWSLGLAAYCAFMSTDFAAATKLSAEARGQAQDVEASLLALATSALATAGADSRSPAPVRVGDLCSGLDDLSGLDGQEAAVFLRYLYSEAALACAEVSLAERIVTASGRQAGPLVDVHGGEHPFTVFIRINQIRVAAFAGRIAAAKAAYDQLLIEMPPEQESAFVALAVEATGILVSGNAAERAQVRTLADRLEGMLPGPRDYFSSGIWLLIAFGLDASGEVRRAARFALTAADGDPDAPRLTIIDRALLIELLVKQAVEEGDLDAAESWCSRVRNLAANPIADSTVARLQARVDILAGRVQEAVVGADQAVDRARSAGRAIEVAEGELVAGQARVALSMPGQARQRLEQMALRSEAEGHQAALVAARRLLRGVGQRLRPAPGSDWSGLSDREREVALLVVAGLSNGEIAAELHISSNTVRVHVSRVLAAFGASSRFAVLAQVAELLPEEPRVLTPLTDRQAAVAERIAKGFGNAEIALELGVSVKTVEKHVTDICRSWQTNSRLGVARLVIGGGLKSE